MHLCVCEVRSVTLGNLKSPNIVKVSASKCLVVPARYICGPKQVVAGYVMSRWGSELARCCSGDVLSGRWEVVAKSVFGSLSGKAV